jgi:hypothetical protein
MVDAADTFSAAVLVLCGLPLLLVVGGWYGLRDLHRELSVFSQILSDTKPHVSVHTAQEGCAGTPTALFEVTAVSLFCAALLI